MTPATEDSTFTRIHSAQMSSLFVLLLRGCFAATDWHSTRRTAVRRSLSSSPRLQRGPDWSAEFAMPPKVRYPCQYCGEEKQDRWERCWSCRMDSTTGPCAQCGKFCEIGKVEHKNIKGRVFTCNTSYCGECWAAFDCAAESRCVQCGTWKRQRSRPLGRLLSEVLDSLEQRGAGRHRRPWVDAHGPCGVWDHVRGDSSRPRRLGCLPTEHVVQGNQRWPQEEGEVASRLARQDVAGKEGQEQWKPVGRYCSGDRGCER